MGYVAQLKKQKMLPISTPASEAGAALKHVAQFALDLNYHPCGRAGEFAGRAVQAR